MTEDHRDGRSNDRADWPTPGPNEPVPSWPEYGQLKEAIHDYLDHEPRDPQWADIRCSTVLKRRPSSSINRRR